MGCLCNGPTPRIAPSAWPIDYFKVDGIAVEGATDELVQHFLADISRQSFGGYELSPKPWVD